MCVNMHPMLLATICMLFACLTTITHPFDFGYKFIPQNIVYGHIVEKCPCVGRQTCILHFMCTPLHSWANAEIFPIFPLLEAYVQIPHTHIHTSHVSTPPLVVVEASICAAYWCEIGGYYLARVYSTLHRVQCALGRLVCFLWNTTVLMSWHCCSPLYTILFMCRIPSSSVLFFVCNISALLPISSSFDT